VKNSFSHCLPEVTKSFCFPHLLKNSDSPGCLRLFAKDDPGIVEKDGVGLPVHVAQQRPHVPPHQVVRLGPIHRLNME